MEPCSLSLHHDIDIDRDDRDEIADKGCNQQDYVYPLPGQGNETTAHDQPPREIKVSARVRITVPFVHGGYCPHNAGDWTIAGEFRIDRYGDQAEPGQWYDTETMLLFDPSEVGAQCGHRDPVVEVAGGLDARGVTRWHIPERKSEITSAMVALARFIAEVRS